MSAPASDPFPESVGYGAGEADPTAGERECTCGAVEYGPAQHLRPCPLATPNAGDASTSASEDVEALVKALLMKHPDGYPAPLQSGYHRRLVAEQILASDWLAAREAKARAEAGEQAWDEGAEAGFDSHAPDDLTDVQARNPYRAARIAREVTR